MTRPDTDLALLLGGMLAIGVGAFAVADALDVGWAGAAVLGVVLIVVARKVPGTARVLSVILTTLGIVALAGAVIGLAV